MKPIPKLRIRLDLRTRPESARSVASSFGGAFCEDLDELAVKLRETGMFGIGEIGEGGLVVVVRDEEDEKAVERGVEDAELDDGESERLRTEVLPFA